MPSLPQYAVIVTVFIILELVSGILGFVYRDELVSYAVSMATPLYPWQCTSVSVVMYLCVYRRAEYLTMP